MIDVITVGSATYDVFLKSHQFKLMHNRRSGQPRGECLAFGSKVRIDDMEVSTGGGATNVAASLRALGLRVSVVARVGNDPYGDAVLEDLRARGIPVPLITRDAQHHTAHATILMMGNGDRTVLVYRGASENLSSATIPWSQLHSTWLYITSLSSNLGLLRKLFTHAARQKQWIAWNPGSLELSHGRGKLSWFMKRATVLFLNEEETRRLTGKLTASHGSLLDALDAISPGVNVMTLGKNGAYVSGNGERLHIASLVTKLVNTTGAGDAFGAGFLAGLIRTDDLRVASKVGALNAAGVVSISGAKNGILSSFPSREQLSRISLTVF